MFTFPSDEWIVEFKNVINSSEKYKEVAAQWEGDVSFICLANSSIGLNEDYAIWADLFTVNAKRQSIYQLRLHKRQGM